jgi:hypothetical protein
LATSEATVVYKLNTQYLNEYKNQVMSYLLPLYLEKQDFIENSVYLHRRVQRLMRVKYNNKSFVPHHKNEINSINSENKEQSHSIFVELEHIERLESEEDRNKKISKLIEELQSNKRETYDSGANIKLNNVFIKKSNSQPNIFSKNKDFSTLSLNTNNNFFKDSRFAKSKSKEKLNKKKVRESYAIVYDRKSLTSKDFANCKTAAQSKNNTFITHKESTNKNNSVSKMSSISTVDHATSRINSSNIKHKKHKSMEMNNTVSVFFNLPKDKMNETFQKNKFLITKVERNNMVISCLDTGSFNSPIVAMNNFLYNEK